MNAPLICASPSGSGAPPRRRRGSLGVLSLAAVAACAALGLTGGAAHAQETTGRIVGQVTDEATHTPQVGVTVILQGQQGEDAALTDDRGEYSFVNLALGTYTVRFYNATSSTNVERNDLVVSAGATLRANVVIPSQVAPQETYVIKKKAAAVDVGSTRLGLTLNEDYLKNLALDRTFGDLVLKAPGAFLESSGDISVAGASGLENVYVTDGLNVTGMEYGNIMNKRSDASGGSNLNIDFVKELQINTGGYRAEFGGAMGGVVNVVTKSGTNDLHGSAFMYWSPYWLAGNTKSISNTASVLSGVDKPDYDMNVGFEVGGPIVKDKAFFWIGFAPRLEKSHFFRDVRPLGEDPMGAATPGDVLMRTRTRELRQSYQYGVKLDWVPTPEHKLTLGLFSTPTASEHVRYWYGEEANNDPRWALQSLHKTNTDVTANWMSQFLERRLRFDASVGLHRESYSEKSPNEEQNSLNQLEYHGAFSLYNFEGIAGCEPRTSAVTGTLFDPCPVGGNSTGYHTGGYGQTKSFLGNRWMGDVKATALLNKNELKAGAHFEYNTFNQTRQYSGPTGGRALVQKLPDYTAIWSFFTIPKGRYASQFLDTGPNGEPDPNMDGNPLDLGDPTMPFYKDSLVANVKSVNSAYFLQDTIHALPNLTFDLGLRYENQKMYDFRGEQFLNVGNLGPRVGVVFDPSNEGRSKVFASYGQFFETIPLNLAARYFGGEGILIRAYDASTCTPPPQDWKGTGNEWAKSQCGYLGNGFFNNGAPYPVQADIKGQSHHEIVAGIQHALTPDLVVGINYTHRWLSAIIEDGAGDATLQNVLANPGNVPQSAKDELQRQIDAKTVELNGLTNPAQLAVARAQLDTLNATKKSLDVLASEPKPERTYDAVTLNASKRLGQSWFFQGSYTYSRLIGNYNGLYDSDNSYFAPNGSNAYDTPDIVLNKRGPLANDRPHSGHVDTYYQLPIGNGTLTGGLSFSAFSGVPRNYISSVGFGQQVVFLLPRGSGGRTDAVTQLDMKLGYRLALSKDTAMELFFDLFNLYNARTALQVDDNYTYDVAAAIVNGNKDDLAHAKNGAGLPITPNSNFGHATAFQAPIHGRLGLRFLF